MLKAIKIITSLLFFLAAVPVMAATVIYPVESSVFVCDANDTCDYANQENETNCQIDCGCNNNNICEAARLEDVSNCPGDCLGSLCGNNTCDQGLGENSGNCPGDCHCGNGACDYSENNSSCPADCPPPQIISPANGVIPSYLTLNNLSISKSGDSSVVISWNSSLPASCNLSWGKTVAYGNGILNEAGHSLSHSADLKDLQFDTRYYFKISCLDSSGNQAKIENTSFLVKSPLVYSGEELILNVKRFLAVPDGTRVELSWIDPDGKNYDQLVIRRSHSFYPDFFEGDVIYRGPSLKKIGEKNIVYDDSFGLKTSYYSIFSIQGENRSSGVLAAIVVSGDKPVTQEAPEIEIIPTASPELDEEKALALDLYDFDFISNNSKLPFIGDQISMKSTKGALIVEIDSLKISSKIKDLILVLSNDNETQSFFMTKNKAGTKFVAEIPGLDSDSYNFNIVAYATSGEVIKEIKSRLAGRDGISDESPTIVSHGTLDGIVKMFFNSLLLLSRILLDYRIILFLLLLIILVVSLVLIRLKR